MKHLDLFSGIGGFALAVDTVWPGSEHVFCEIDPFCQNVLRKHWPNAEIYGDIRTLTNAGYENAQGHEPLATSFGKNKGIESSPQNRPFILTGGFPCQPFSQAGKRKGTEDDRHLWPQMLRVIQLTKPTWVIAENVRGLLTLQGGVVFEQVCLDLEASGYEVQPIIIPAVAVNAPHRRDRIWFVAHNNSGRSQKQGAKQQTEWDRQDGKDVTTNTTSERSGRRTSEKRRTDQRELGAGEQKGSAVRGEGQGCDGIDWERSWQEVAFATCDVRMDDGLPKRVVRLPDGSTISEAKWRQQALKGYGNAIVPQVAIEIMQAIKNTYGN